MSSAPTSQSNPFPYHIYYGKDVNGQKLMSSWRLKSDPTTVPKAWIWVAGTSGAQHFADSPLLAEICEYLGRRIGSEKFGIITGAWKGVAVAVGQSFSQTLLQVNPRADIQDFHKIYTTQETILPEVKKKSDVNILTDTNTIMETIPKHCDACIMLESMKGITQAAQKCLDYGKPVFPLVETGGAAERFYSGDLLSLDKDRFTKIYGPDFKLEDLKLNYKDAIDAIMRFLDQRFKSEGAESDHFAWEQLEKQFGEELETLKTTGLYLSSIEIESDESVQSYIERYLEDAIEALRKMASDNENIKDKLEETRSELELARDEVFQESEENSIGDVNYYYQDVAAEASTKIASFLDLSLQSKP